MEKQSAGAPTGSDKAQRGNEDKAQRGNEIFERKVRPHVDVEKEARKYVIIDLASEDFEVDRNQRAAFDRLVQRQPEAQSRQTLWLRRVGSRYAHHFGGRLRDEDLR